MAGFLGLIGGFATAFLGELGKNMNAKDADTVSNLGAAAFWISVIIMFISIIIFVKPRIPSIIIIILAIAATIVGNFFSGPLALVGGILGLISSFKKKDLSKVSTSLNQNTQT